MMQLEFSLTDTEGTLSIPLINENLVQQQDIQVLLNNQVAQPEDYVISLESVPGTTSVSLIKFTPATSGVFLLYTQTKALAEVRVGLKTSTQKLTEIWEETFGGWNWDKLTGKMVLTSPTGVELAIFDMQATDTSASRVRV